ncbi:MAG: hypothetical protein WC707_01130 [Candidatus Babeliaceae bacterium]|jgi:hypothetical protein
MKHTDHNHSSHEASLYDELTCHLPYAAFSVAIGFIVLSLLHFMSMNLAQAQLHKGYHILFHAFHYLHIMFAVTGTLVTFLRFSNHLTRGIIVSLISPAVFCTLSDVALPALAGNILGVHMDMHICFFKLHDFMNVLPFMLVGLITALSLSRHHVRSLNFISLGSHFIHILISSLASLFYVVSYGFSGWPKVMGILYFFLVIAVVIPCTFSDVVVPLYFARKKNKAAHKDAH